ncbi:Protein Wnt-4 [Armadillidium nasatum]|uniref:Protein Wnt n=1 Tax=Armadillidium nasatum TaxID=96803 RepID=A0A5N5THS5_9CRUS|nr:Protein Wnt-4 [Armadillidium nasatum]
MKFCRDHPAFMKAVRDGAKWAIEECQFQFRTRRWNCSTLNEELLRAQRSQDKIEIVPIPTERMQRTESSPATSINVTIDSGIDEELDKEKEKEKEREIEEAEDEKYPTKNDVSRLLKSKKKGKKISYGRSRRYRRGKKGRKPFKKGKGPVFPQGTREAAFVHAISSAGVAHAITRKCSSGMIEDCGCDRSVRGTTKNGFQWEGCSDNIAYGISLSKRFVDAKDVHLIRKSKRIKRNKKQRSRVARSLMNLHNNEAGRKIGELLKEKFDGATEVKSEIIGGRAELQPNQQFFKRPTETDLVYLSKSPEYCERDLKHGSLGTVGRRCNKGSHSLDGCDLLCCGRGYTSHWVKVKERCNCKFHWCCYVKCSVCTRNEEVHICK